MEKPSILMGFAIAKFAYRRESWIPNSVGPSRGSGFGAAQSEKLRANPRGCGCGSGDPSRGPEWRSFVFHSFKPRTTHEWDHLPSGKLT